MLRARLKQHGRALRDIAVLGPKLVHVRRERPGPVSKRPRGTREFLAGSGFRITLLLARCPRRDLPKPLTERTDPLEMRGLDHFGAVGFRHQAVLQLIKTAKLSRDRLARILFEPAQFSLITQHGRALRDFAVLGPKLSRDRVECPGPGSRPVSSHGDLVLVLDVRSRLNDWPFGLCGAETNLSESRPERA